MHRLGFVHRDLYLSHIFFHEGQLAGPKLSLIDLQRVGKPRWRQSRWVVKDLAALNFSAPASLISRADRLRWLVAYLRCASLDAAGRRLAYRVIGKTERIARKELRRRRT
jgi:hypothetical protein